MTAPSAPATLAALRRLLLGLLLVGLAGTATDLLLLAHYEDAWQLLPLVIVGIAALAAIGVAAGRPVPPVVAVKSVPGDDAVADRERRRRHGAALSRQHGVQARDGSLAERVRAVLERRPRQGPAGPGAGDLALLGLLGLVSVFRRRDDPPTGDR